MFNVLLEVIDNTLSALGERPKRIIYHHFQEKYGVGPEHIPSMINEFHDALRFYFGDQATHTIEKMIARSYSEKQGLNFVWSKDWTLRDCIEKLKEQTDQPTPPFSFILLD